MEADRRLIQDEERPDERGAQGRGEVDPLGLPAAQGEGHPVERDVIEPDFEEEFQAVLDLGDELFGHLPLKAGSAEEPGGSRRPP